MKKVSTGERIKFADLRRRSVGGPRGEPDSDVTTEQLFVSELMDTTPSSSYEGETWREGIRLYNPRDASVSDAPHVRYDSDGEAADEVVTDKKDVVGKADLIVKEDVPEVGETCASFHLSFCRNTNMIRAFHLSGGWLADQANRHRRTGFQILTYNLADQPPTNV